MHSTAEKICTLDRLVSLREQARADGKRVVHCHGCFDIVHPGHVHHLQFAKTLGDVLVVTLTADSNVNKGANRPLIPDDLRAANLAALECVDWVYINPEPTAVPLLETLRPDVYVKGREYEHNQDPRFQAERDVTTKHGGKVVFTSGDVIFSSTALINDLEGTAAFANEKLKRFRARYDLNHRALADLLHRFRGLKVAVVGDYLLDRYHFCEATGISSEGPCMALRSLRTRDYDGGAAVIALHLAGLGAEATLVSGFANDDHAKSAQLRLRGDGVEVAGLNCRRQTTVKHRYLVDTQKMMKIDEGTQGAIDSDAEETLAGVVLEAARNADAVIFSDFGQGLITPGLLQRVMPTLRRQVKCLAATVSGKQSSLMRFTDLDLLCATEQEVRESLHDFSSGLTAVAWQLVAATRVPNAIITLGKQGLVVCDRHQMVAEGESWERRLRNEYIHSLCHRPTDPLGCGDALLATATLTLAAGGSVQAAGLLGSAAAAVHASRLGNPPLRSDDLFARLARPDFDEATRLAS